MQTNRKLDPERCIRFIYQDFSSHQCMRKAWKDDYCKQHHPKEEMKRRDTAALAYQERQKKEPWYLLKVARERIAQLEAEVSTLRLTVAQLEKEKL